MVLLWSVAMLALAWSVFLDLQQSGKPASFLNLLWNYWLPSLPQMLYSTAAGLVLARHPEWVMRPWRLGLGALATVPIYLGLCEPLVVLLSKLGAGKSLGEALATWGPELQKWPALNWYLDAIIASGALALQLGWRFWLHAKARRQQALQARAENLRLRLGLLQGQLEPHFMFNTLNSIAALVRSAERSVALAALNRLSELLRYSLRASQKRWVSVADELRFVADYVALQRLRFGDALHWQQQIQQRSWERWACPPLLLQPLMEAAIRQSMESGAEAPLCFELGEQGGRLQLRLSQAGAVDAPPADDPGLGRLQERLRALYPGAAELQCHGGADGFDWRLLLPLRDLDECAEDPT